MISRGFLFLFSMFICTGLFARQMTQDSSRVEDQRFGRDVFLAAGIAVGHENLISLPKVCFFKPYSLSGHDLNPGRSGLYKKSFYTGFEISFLVPNVLMVSASATTGLNYKFLTLDHSITPSVVVVRDQATRYRWTYNPRLGLAIDRFWFRFGPGFYLTKRDIENWVEWNGQPFNLEFLYMIPYN